MVWKWGNLSFSTDMKATTILSSQPQLCSSCSFWSSLPPCPLPWARCCRNGSSRATMDCWALSALFSVLRSFLHWENRISSLEKGVEHYFLPESSLTGCLTPWRRGSEESSQSERFSPKQGRNVHPSETWTVTCQACDFFPPGTLSAPLICNYTVDAENF